MNEQDRGKTDTGKEEKEIPQKVAEYLEFKTGEENSFTEKDNEYWEILLKEGRRTVDKQSELFDGLRSDSFTLIKFNLLLASLIFAVQQSVFNVASQGIPDVVLLFTGSPILLSIWLSWNAHQKSGKSRIGTSEENIKDILDNEDSYEELLRTMTLSQYRLGTKNKQVADKVTNRMFYAIVLLFMSLGALTGILAFY